MEKMQHRFRVGLWAGLVFAVFGLVDNARNYFKYQSAIPKADNLVPLDMRVVERALDTISLTQEQRGVILKNIRGDQQSIASLHGVLMESLHALQNKYKNCAVEWSGLVFIFAGLLLMDSRRGKL
jgi:hypothetical protein